MVRWAVGLEGWNSAVYPNDELADNGVNACDDFCVYEGCVSMRYRKPSEFSIVRRRVVLISDSGDEPVCFDSFWPRVRDSKGASTMSTFWCVKLPACPPSFVAEGATDVVFLDPSGCPLALLCSVLGSSKYSTHFIETIADVRFRTISGDIADCLAILQSLGSYNNCTLVLLLAGNEVE